MKLFKTLIAIAIIITTVSFNSHAQSYAKLRYWGKDFQLDQNFFVYLNQNWDSFIKSANNYKNYDYQDYSKIYIDIVEWLKSNENIIHVTEANQLQFTSNTMFMPGQVLEPKRSKKSTNRAVFELYQVLLPSLTQFVANDNRTHQYNP